MTIFFTYFYFILLSNIIYIYNWFCGFFDFFYMELSQFHDLDHEFYQLIQFGLPLITRLYVHHANLGWLWPGSPLFYLISSFLKFFFSSYRDHFCFHPFTIVIYFLSFNSNKTNILDTIKTIIWVIYIFYFFWTRLQNLNHFIFFFNDISVYIFFNSFY